MMVLSEISGGSEGRAIGRMTQGARQLPCLRVPDDRHRQIARLIDGPTCQTLIGMMT
jgi:hypothetical protein